MDLGLANRVAIVTAASRGLGRAAAEALGEAGVKLVVNARSAPRLEQLADCIATDVIQIQGDLRDSELPDQLVGTALERFGRLDILVANNAGPPAGGAFSVSEQEIFEAIEANLMVFIRLARAAVTPMQEAGWGRICMVASGSAKQPMDGLALSNIARPGLWGWAKTAANELSGGGVTMNVICPGLHPTDRAVELGRENSRDSGDPQMFGRIVAFMCSEHTAFMNGTTLIVDGGRVQGL